LPRFSGSLAPSSAPPTCISLPPPPCSTFPKCISLPPLSLWFDFLFSQERWLHSIMWRCGKSGTQSTGRRLNSMAGDRWTQGGGDAMLSLALSYAYLIVMTDWISWGLWGRKDLFDFIRAECMPYSGHAECMPYLNKIK
jgi:hypothetical protein